MSEEGQAAPDSGIFGYPEMGDGVSTVDDPFEAQSHIPGVESDPSGFPIPREQDLEVPEEEPEEFEGEDDDEEPEEEPSRAPEEESEDDSDEDDDESEEDDDESDDGEIEYKYKGKMKTVKMAEARRILGLQENWQKKHEEAAGEQRRYQELQEQFKAERAKFTEEQEKFRSNVEQSQAALKRILENPLEAYTTVLKSQGYAPHEAKRRAWEHAQNAIREQIAWEAMPETDRMQHIQRDQETLHQEQLRAHQEQVARLEAERQRAEIRARYAPVAHEVKLRMAEYDIPASAIPNIEQIYLEAERSGTPMSGSQAVDEYRARTSDVSWRTLARLSPEALEEELEKMPKESRKALEKFLQKNRLSKGKETYKSRTTPKRRGKKSPRPNSDRRPLSPSDRFRKYRHELADPDVNLF